MISVDTVYQKVLALLNKEQRGYMTPQEFNLLADKAQFEIFENYFHDLKTSYHKPIKNHHSHADDISIIEEKLHPFKEQQTLENTSGTITLAVDVYRLICVTRENDLSSLGFDVEEISKRKLQYVTGNPLTAPTKDRSIYVRYPSSTGFRIKIYPIPESPEVFTYEYYRRPKNPNWTYIVTGGKALYNASANDAQDFTLVQAEEEPLVTRILELAGVVVMKPGIVEIAKSDRVSTKAEQNN
tara:strand:+ start:687 stop:1409 length:723 start_codon:yes stop_codon:yes gene_type:complete